MSDTGEPPMTDSNFDYGTFILLFPFFAIPASIIIARLVKYIWKIYQARKYGFGNDILEDPLAELGLKFRRGYENTTEIRKLRKEKTRIQKQAIKDRVKDMKRSEEIERVANGGRRFSSKLNDFVPIHAAEEYLNHIRQQTAKTWYEKLSPDALRRWVDLSRYARLWMVLQVTCTFLAIINYVALTYLALRDDRDERTLIKNLDLAYACFFLLDYVLSFYIAEDRLAFYAQPMSLVDLMSIVSPFVYLFVASPTKYVWFIGFVRIFRATRIMRTYRLLAFAQSEETRELAIFTLNFINFIFFSASVINATEALEFAPEPPTLKRWHDSLYYILVTFSTIGFGDLTPTSSFSRVVVMFLIILVVLYVPYQTGKILEIFNSLTKYQRARYSVKNGGAHVILAGDITYSSIIDFCREFFMIDEIATVVILSNVAPIIDIRRLLNHPFYRARIVYVQGSMLSHTDLKRAQADYATGMFILANEDASCENQEEEDSKVYENDSKVLLRSLYAKTSFPGLSIFAQLNDYRSKDLADHCGIDRVVALDEIKATLFASNCACPGILTLILNLIHSYKEVDPGSLREFWTAEYECGLVSQIQSMKVPSGLVGVKYGEAIKEVFDAYNVMIFALVSNNNGFNQNQIRFNIPKDYKLKVDDIAFCIGDGADEQTLRIAMQFKERREYEKDVYEADIDLEKLHDPSSSKDLPPARDGFVFSPNSQVLNLDSDFSQIELGLIPSDISDHIIVAGHVSARIILHFVKSLRERKMFSQGCNAARNDTKIVLILNNLPNEDNLGTIWQEILGFNFIYALKGRAAQKSVLERARIADCKQIVVFSKQGAEYGSSDAQSVFMEWPHVKFLVELIDGANVKYFSSKTLEWDTNNLRMQSIMNNYSLTIGDRQSLYRSLRTEGAEKNTLVYQLLQFMIGQGGQPNTKSSAPTKKDPIQKTASAGDYDSLLSPLVEEKDNESLKKEIPVTEVYLQRALEQAELNESGLNPYPIYHFDRHFAAGMVASTSFMQTLLCQSFFRPFIIDIVRGLIANSCTLPVKPSIIGKQYIEVVEVCLNEGYIPLGLLRNGASKSGEILPYVYTNCRHGDIVKAEDLIFVLKS